MIPFITTGLFTAIILGLCFSQKQESSRQHAAFVYGFGTALHFLSSTYAQLSWPAYSWEIYYASAAVSAWIIFEIIHRMPLYSTFHEKLKLVAGGWVLINLFGFLIDLADLSRIPYYVLSFTLYTILIMELWNNGRPTRVLEERSLFRHFRTHFS